MILSLHDTWVKALPTDERARIYTTWQLITNKTFGQTDYSANTSTWFTPTRSDSSLTRPQNPSLAPHLTKSSRYFCFKQQIVVLLLYILLLVESILSSHHAITEHKPKTFCTWIIFIHTSLQQQSWPLPWKRGRHVEQDAPPLLSLMQLPDPRCPITTSAHKPEPREWQQPLQ